jgi:putative sigma-54 modulation protein
MRIFRPKGESAMKNKVEEKRRKVMRKQRRAARGPVATTVTVTFRHLDPSSAVRGYAERKFAHLGKFLKRACEAHVILSVDKYRQHGEVTVKSGRLSATAEQESRDLYSVIDLLEDKIVRQLTRHLEKIATNKVRTLSAGELLSEAEES